MNAAANLKPLGPALGRGVLTGLAGLGFVALAHLDVTVCPFANLTGHPCPGCGLTRAAFALLTGHFETALRLHPLSPVLVPLVAWFVLDGARRFVMQKPASTKKIDPRVSGIGFATLSVALIVIWAVRFLGYLGGPVSVHGLWSR